MNEQHPLPSQHKAFVRGELDEADVTRMLAHLEQCEACLNEVDRLWQQLAQAESAGLALPNAESRARVEARLLRRLRRRQLGERTVRLGTQGFFQVLVALLRPLFGLGQRQPRG